MSKNTLEIIAKVRSWMKGQDTMVGKRAIALARFVDRFKVEEYLDELEAAYKSENHCEKRFDKDGDEMPPHCAFDDLKIDRLKGKVQELEARTGNVAKLREALENAQKFLGNIDFDKDSDLDDMAAPVVAEIGKALAAPPRNCDVGTALEQAKRFKEFCDEHTDSGRNPNCGMCPILIHHETKDACQFYWGQMPCESPEDPEKRGAE